MPTTGPINVNKSDIGKGEDGYFSLFSHSDEVIKPGYYSVKLKKYDINVQLTAANRS